MAPPSPPTLRTRLRGRSLRPYEAFLPEDLPGRRDTTLTAGGLTWRCPGRPRIALNPGVAWDEIAGDDRGWAFHLHAWDALAPLLRRLSDEGRSDVVLGAAIAIALDWIERYPTTDTASEFAWYDIGVGLRAYRLAFLIDVAAHSEAVTDEQLSALLGSLGLHAELLRDDGRFAANNNHGIYQAAGQLAMATRLPALPGMAGDRELGLRRLRGLVGRHFAPDGVHLEHSPAYHAATLRVLQQLGELAVIDDPEILRVRRRAEQALEWFVAPDGSLVAFGDTDLGRGPAGGAGTGPGGLRVFDEGGFVVYRSPGDGRPATYLAQICAFHSRVHKHADDLSVVWWDRGRPLLVDVGRFEYLGRMDPASPLGQLGFWYSHPSRVYAESTRAHNTVEIDDASHDRRTRTPYGSAVVRAGEQDGVIHMESEVIYHETIAHNRLVLLRPGAWMIVMDALHDDAVAVHRFVQRFHLAPSLSVEALGDGFSAWDPELATPLYVAPLLGGAPLAPVRGQREPELLGWAATSPAGLEPAWTVAFEADGVSRHVFATVLTFGDSRPLVDRPATWTAIDGGQARLVWSTGSRVSAVEISRDAHTIEISHDEYAAEDS